MSKRIISRRRGKGSHTYKANSHKAKGGVEYPRGDKTGEVVSIEHDPGRTAPIAKVKFSEEDKEYILAPEGMTEGDEITISRDAPLETGNTLPLKEIPEGVPIYNIELTPGDGGKIARSSGTHGFIVTHTRDSAKVRLPSKSIKDISPDCRATIGKVSGAGRTDKDLKKAGDMHHKSKARGKLYPRTSAVAMNATDHPFGGSADPGRPKTVSGDSPPGQKVGNISAKRSGKKKE
ncbi:MAG: 50S ribosomal protein L2 [Candidatus Nanohaloarchaeota archaeon QJJ-9]|nr:50S ribosomal protein L2 [Candidatus Nanohaloarchaeota archaeon QJJ-9]